MEMFNIVRQNDTVYDESIRRLARSIKDFKNIIVELNDTGASFISQKVAIDAETLHDKFMLIVFDTVAKLEGERIKQRQAKDITITKAEGKYKGRIPKEHEK